MFKLPIQLTEAAEEYLKDIGDPNVSLTVKGGGCAGFQYVWGTTDKEPKVGNLWVDPMAEMFVFGCTITIIGFFIAFLVIRYNRKKEDERIKRKNESKIHPYGDDTV